VTGEQQMHKIIACLAILLTISAVTTVSTLDVSAQNADIDILSYDYYYDNLGNAVVIGEVQNVGVNILANVTLAGLITTTDEVKAESGCYISVRSLLPNQKSSFYMEFHPQLIGQNSWFSTTIDRVDLNVYEASPTDQYQYQDVIITSQTAAPEEGVYWVDCDLKNNGAQTATNIKVYGTFYNTLGDVVAVGDSITSISSLAPQATTTIRVPAFDRNQTLMAENQKISSFRLLVQVQSPTLTGNAPVIDPSSTPVNPGTSPDSNSSGEDSTLTYAIIGAVVAIVAVVAVLFLVRSPKPKQSNRIQPAEPVKPKNTKPRNKK